MKLLPITVKTMAKPVADEAAEMLLGDRELIEGIGLLGPGLLGPGFGFRRMK